METYTYTREQDNEYIIQGMKSFATGVTKATGTILPGIVLATLSVMVTEWIAIATVASGMIFVPWTLFRIWRVKRSRACSH